MSTTTYSAAQLRALHQRDFGTWTGRRVVVQDGRGVELARGVLKGFTYQQLVGLRLDGSTVGKLGDLVYAFSSGGTPDGADLVWESSHS